MVKITFSFGKDCADFLKRLTTAELNSLYLDEVEGHRVLQIFDGDTPTEDYCATLVFPDSSPEIIRAEPVIEVAH